MQTHLYPFLAIIGQEELKIGGIVVRGERGDQVNDRKGSGRLVKICLKKYVRQPWALKGMLKKNAGANASMLLRAKTLKTGKQNGKCQGVVSNKLLCLQVKNAYIITHKCSFIDNWCRFESRRIGKYARFVHCTRNCYNGNFCIMQHGLMVHEQKRYDHCVYDFRPGNPREDRDGCIRLKSGDLPVTLLHNTTTGYSQAMRFLFIQDLYSLRSLVLVLLQKFLEFFPEQKLKPFFAFAPCV